MTVPFIVEIIHFFRHNIRRIAYCYLDFTKKGCNKGKGLSLLQKHYGITYEETAAFGNADNDISLIEKAKYGYAVGNASEGLKKAAYEVLAPMQEDAVLGKLKEILEEME